MDDTCLKMSKKLSCLCFCVCGLEPVYIAWTYAYTGLFLRLSIREDRFAYAGSCLRAWALTCIHETLSRGPTLLIFTSLSTFSLLYAILTSHFVIFAFEHHCILLFIFTLTLTTSFFIVFA